MQTLLIILLAYLAVGCVVAVPVMIKTGRWTPHPIDGENDQVGKVAFWIIEVMTVVTLWPWGLKMIVSSIKARRRPNGCHA
jgi:hypothetical protein